MATSQWYSGDMDEQIYTDKFTKIQYRKDADDNLYYRRADDMQWIKAGNLNDMQNAKLPLEVISLVTRINANRRR